MWNWVDLVIIVAVILFGLSGYFKGFIRQIADFLIIIIALFLSVWFYLGLSGYIATRFSIAPNFSKIIAFFAIWVIVQFVLNIVVYFLYPKIPEKLRKSVYNRALGAIPGVLWGVIFIAIFLTLFVAFPIQTKYKDAVLASKTGSLIVQKSSGIEKYVSGIFGGAINDTLTFLTVKPNSGETVDLGFKTTKVGVDAASEEEMLRLVNKERTSRGLRALVMDEKLREVARAHSKDMFARGYFAHNNPDGKDPFARMDEAGIKFLVAGENLALAPNVALAHEGLMNSPGHRANILTAEFGKIGIGCIDGGQYGKMFSQEFTD
jgi:uncharacterized protein YkwD